MRNYSNLLLNKIKSVETELAECRRRSPNVSELHLSNLQKMQKQLYVELERERLRTNALLQRTLPPMQMLDSAKLLLAQDHLEAALKILQATTPANELLNVFTARLHRLDREQLLGILPREIYVSERSKVGHILSEFLRGIHTA